MFTRDTLTRDISPEVEYVESFMGATYAVDIIEANSCSSGVRVRGDNVAGDTLVGDTLAGDTLVGDTLAGDELTGDTLAGDTLTGDAVSMTTPLEENNDKLTGSAWICSR